MPWSASCYTVTHSCEACRVRLTSFASPEDDPRGSPNPVGGLRARPGREFIVESSLSKDFSIVLEPYGEGADTESLRILDSRTDVTHRICCTPRTGNKLEELIEGTRVTFPSEGLPLVEFVSCRDAEWYKIAPPFNAVHLHDPDDHLGRSHSDAPVIFARKDIRFHLHEISNRKPLPHL